MNRPQFLQRVAALVSDKMDGDVVLTIESHLPDALSTVCRWIAEFKPVGHEKILARQNIDSSQWLGEGGHLDGYLGINFSLFPVPIVVMPTLYHVEANVLSTDDFKNIDTMGHSVRTMRALELAVSHNAFYYFVEPEYMYFKIGAYGNDAPDSITVVHHAYKTLETFPDELGNFLVAEIVKIISNEPAKQNKEQQDI